MHSHLEHTFALKKKVRPGFVASLILAAVSSLPMFADPASTSNVDALVLLSGIVDVTVGTHRSDVSQRLGNPRDTLSPDVWIYWDYRDPRRAADERYQTLVIIFNGDEVSRMRFTDTKETRTMVSNFRRDQAVTRLLTAGANPLVVGNKAIAVKSKDSEMSAAIRDGRASIRTFLNAFLAPTTKQSSLLVKFAFIEDSQVEDLWVSDLDLSGAKPTGVIATSPRRKDLRLKQRVEVDLACLSD